MLIGDSLQMAEEVAHIGPNKELQDQSAGTEKSTRGKILVADPEKHARITIVIGSDEEYVNSPKILTDDSSTHGGTENEIHQYLEHKEINGMLESGTNEGKTVQDFAGSNANLTESCDNGLEDQQPREIGGTAKNDVLEMKDYSGDHITGTSNASDYKAKTATPGTDNTPKVETEVSGDTGIVEKADSSTVNRKTELSDSSREIPSLAVEQGVAEDTSDEMSGAAEFVNVSEDINGDAERGSRFELVNVSESSGTENENVPEFKDPPLQSIPNSDKIAPNKNEKIKEVKSDDISEILRPLSNMSLIGYPDEDEWSTRLKTLRERMEEQTTQAQQRRDFFQRRKREIVVRQNRLIETQLQHRNLRYGILPKIKSNKNSPNNTNLEVPENFPVTENGSGHSSNYIWTPSKEDPFIAASMEPRSQTTIF